MLIVASLSLGTRIVTELTVLELRGRGKQLLDRQQKLQLLRVVLCSFHVDAPLAHQLNEIQNSIFTLPLPHGKW